MGLILVTGPNGSGKSARAEQIAIDTGDIVSYIATLPNLLIYQDRIRQHQERRPPSWKLIELSGHLSLDWHKLEQIYGQTILLDGLAMYLSRIMPLLPSSQEVDSFAKRIVFYLTHIRKKNDNFIVVTTDIQYESDHARDIFCQVLGNLREHADRIIDLNMY
jgi:adenosylcobinamide kinase/adenosylcobinamide-phosphate guanylyltransferase